jgi:hypothetical protein
MLAYLDPATGGMALQAIVGAVAAAAVTGRLWWGKVKRTLRPNHAEASRQDDLGA